MLNDFLLAAFSAGSTLYRALNPPLPLDVPGEINGRTIAVFSTAGIGDTLTDTVAVRALRETFPKSRLVAVVHEKRRALLEHNPHIDQLIPHAKSAFVRTLSAVRAARPYLSVVLRANDPDIFPLAYAAARRVLGNPLRTKLPHLVTVSAEISREVWDRTHGVEQTLMVVARIGAKTQDKRLVYTVTDLERQDARDLLAIHGIPGRTAIAVQVTRRRHGPARDWPADSYRTFLAAVRRKIGRHPIVLLSGAAERDYAESLAEPVNAISFAGDLTLRQSAAVLEQCACLVTPDTGLMHLSFAVGCRTLAMLSILPPDRVGPYGYTAGHHVCVVSPAGRPLSDLPPDTVFQTLTKHFL